MPTCAPLLCQPRHACRRCGISPAQSSLVKVSGSPPGQAQRSCASLWVPMPSTNPPLQLASRLHLHGDITPETRLTDPQKPRCYCRVKAPGASQPLDASAGRWDSSQSVAGGRLDTPPKPWLVAPDCSIPCEISRHFLSPLQVLSLGTLCLLRGGWGKRGCFFPSWKRQKSFPLCQISPQPSSVSH